MQYRILLILSVAVIFFSCKKSDVSYFTNPSGDSTSNIVYNVNKTQLLQLVNNVRAQGCTCGTTSMPAVGPLSWNNQLAKAAYDHSVDMYTNDYFSHTGSDNSDPGQRITTAGYAWSFYGENIAEGFTSEQAVMNAWLGSEGHCKNIMDGSFTDMGAGRDGNYWTQDFGAH